MAAKRKMVKDRLGAPVEHYSTYLNHMLEESHCFNCPTCQFYTRTADDQFKFCPRCGFTGNAYVGDLDRRNKPVGKQVFKAQPGI